MVGVSNFRHAQYDAQGVGIDDPQELYRSVLNNILRASNGRTSRPVLGVCGTSITETRPYLSSTGFLDLSNGTYSITFGSSVRSFIAEGDVVQVTQGPAALSTRRATVISISANNLTIVVRPDAAFAVNLTGAAPLVYYSTNYTAGSYIAYAAALAQCRPIIGPDAAIGGADTAQILTTLSRDLLDAPYVDAYICEVGSMNGIYARGNSLATEMGLVKSYVDLIATKNVPFLIVGVLPRGSATGAWTAAKRDIALQINNYLNSYVPQKGGSFLDPYKAFLGSGTYLNFASTEADPRITQTTTDGVHPNPGGGVILGSEVASWLDKIFPAADIGGLHPKESANNLMNPTTVALAGTTGTLTGGAGATVTGQLATGCTLVVTVGGADTNVTCSVIARTTAVHGDPFGNVQRLVITTGATANHTIEFQFTGNLSASFTNGDRVRGSAFLTVSNGGTPGSGSPVALGSAGVFVLTQTATTINKPIHSIGSGNSSDAAIEGHTGYYETVPGAINSPSSIHGAVSFVRGVVTLYLKANASVCIDIGRPAIWKNPS